MESRILSQDDNLLKKAIELVQKSNITSISALKVGLGIDDQRVGWLIDELKLIGVLDLKAKGSEQLVVQSHNPAQLKAIISLVGKQEVPNIDGSGATEIVIRANRSLKSALALLHQIQEYALVNDYYTITDEVVLEALNFVHIVEPVRRDRTGISFEVKCLEVLRHRGLEVQLTGRTGDGGIDIIARSHAPIAGGKYVVQCKDWRGSVGSPIVRDLYGVVHAEDADRGILITSSTFTADALKFAEGKRLELIDGARLDYIIVETTQK